MQALRSHPDDAAPHRDASMEGALMCLARLVRKGCTRASLTLDKHGNTVAETMSRSLGTLQGVEQPGRELRNDHLDGDHLLDCPDIDQGMQPAVENKAD